jgi:type VI secretion system protein ImpJ
MSFNRHIFWQQGTFLEPQHFQLLELQRRNELAFLLGALQPYPWGLAELVIDREALANFTFQVLKLDLWMPDGRRLILPGNLQLPSRSFLKAWTNTDTPLEVFLSVPVFSLTSPNVSVQSPGKPDFKQRLYLNQDEPEMVPDLLGQGPDGRVETLDFNAHLLFGDEAKEAVEAVTLAPLAHLRRDGEKISLDIEYAPPSIRIYSDNPLRQLMLDLLEILKAKARQLEEYKISPSQINLEHSGGTALSLFMLLGVVCRYISRVHFLLVPASLHPFTAFSAIRELAAELTVFVPGLSALGESLTGQGGALKPYDHQNPYPAFQETKLLIARLLDAVSLGPELVLNFTREGRNFVLDLPATLNSGFSCWLSVNSDLPKEKLAESLSSFGKLASTGRVESLVSFNLPGIALTLLTSPPLGLPRTSGTAYFSIRQTDPMWDEVLKTRRLVLFWDQAPETTMVTLSANHL